MALLPPEGQDPNLLPLESFLGIPLCPGIALLGSAALLRTPTRPSLGTSFLAPYLLAPISTSLLYALKVQFKALYDFCLVFSAPEPRCSPVCTEHPSPKRPHCPLQECPQILQCIGCCLSSWIALIFSLVKSCPTSRASSHAPTSTKSSLTLGSHYLCSAHSVVETLK